MTATTSMTATAPRTVPARAGASVDARMCALSIGVLTFLYLLLQNPYWVPGGDSEVYTAVARNLVLGKGYTFNGQPVGMITPGWPWALALVMKISPTFLLLKLFTMSCMLGSLAFGYFICRRFTGPRLAALTIVLAGTISHVYSLTFWLHSDALFCLTSAASLLLAMQISEKHPQAGWRIALLLALCGVNVVVRWAGVLTYLLVAAALLDGQIRPHLNRIWLTLACTAALTGATFFILRHELKVSKQVEEKTKDWLSESGNEPTIVPNADPTLAQAYKLVNETPNGWHGYVSRVQGWGHWFGYLLWQPLRIGRANAALNTGGLLLGWFVLLLTGTFAVQAARRRKWLFASLMIYSLGLAMLWPKPNARYLVPVAPLIVLAVFRGLWTWREWFPAPRMIPATRWLAFAFVFSLAACNGALYACDVWVARSGNFYDRYEAGLNRDLISADFYLNRLAVPDGQIAVSPHYNNLGKTSNSQLGLRATALLTGKAILALPVRYTRTGDPRNNPSMLAWARSSKIGVKYVLYQPDVSPWRALHFRMAWLQRLMTHQPVVDTGAGWRLYEIPPTGDDAVRVSVPAKNDWPTRVPGL